MPTGGLYAKWDDKAAKATWFYSQERDIYFKSLAATRWCTRNIIARDSAA